MEHQFGCCLWFDHHAEEAAEFYLETFEDTRRKETFYYVTDDHGKIGDTLTITLELAGCEIMLLNGDESFKPTPAISYVVNCENDQQLQFVWERLNSNGETLMPLTNYPELGKFGWTTDRFGFSWQVRLWDNLQTILPCIMFANQNYGLAQAAMDEWINIFGGKRNFMIKGKEERLRAAGFQLRGQDLIIMDRPEKQAFDFSMANSFYLYYKDQADIDAAWESITKTGKEWPCGWMEDKYGVYWQTASSQLNDMLRDPNQEKAKRATLAMYEMKKIDLAKMQRAHDGID